MNSAQIMWTDVITAVLSQPTFDMTIGNMGYVFKNMIAKYVSSADSYRVSNGVCELVIEKDTDLMDKISGGLQIDMKKYFYGKDKPTLLEHTIPTSVIAQCLIDLGPSPDKCSVSNVLKNSGAVVIVLRTEDKLLAKSKMPPGWVIGDSIYARYEEAGVIISESIFVKRDRNIYR